jgi:hypothetical protein
MGESNFSVKWFAFFARLRGKPKSHTKKERERAKESGIRANIRAYYPQFSVTK